MSRISPPFVDVARQLLAVLGMAGFLVGTAGVPLPRVATPGKDGSQPFPCMDRPCGCQTADQCWRACCCLTNRQKLAWACARGLEVPGFVAIAAAKEESQVPSACCADGHKPSPAGDDDCDDDCDAVELAQSPGAYFVLAIEARKCQGQAELWLALGAAPLPAKTEVEWRRVACGAACIAPLRLTGRSPLPPTPPPRA